MYIIINKSRIIKSNVKIYRLGSESDDERIVLKKTIFEMSNILNVIKRSPTRFLSVSY